MKWKCDISPQDGKLALFPVANMGATQKQCLIILQFYSIFF